MSVSGLHFSYVQYILEKLYGVRVLTVIQGRDTDFCVVQKMAMCWSIQVCLLLQHIAIFCTTQKSISRPRITVSTCTPYVQTYHTKDSEAL